MNASTNWNSIVKGFGTFIQSNSIVLAGLLLLLLILERLASLLADRYVNDDERRHLLKKWVRYTALFFGFLCILFLYGTYANKDTFFFVGLFLAGIAISLRDIFSNFIGWLIINSPKGFRHGDRIKIGSIVSGDVIDISVLRTTLMEIGEWVEADQSTGRLVSVPNSLILTNQIYNYTVGHDLIWNEMKIMVTFESDWERAEKIMLKIAQNDFEGKKDYIIDRLRKVRKRYILRYNFITPKVYIKIADSGVLLTLRYMVMTRKRRTMDDELSREVLLQFAKEPAIEFAYPTMRIFRQGETTSPALKESS